MAVENAMQVFNALNKSNCRECGEKTCLAFASAVFLGKLKLRECPYLDAETIASLSAQAEQAAPAVSAAEEELAKLRLMVQGTDLKEAAKRTGGIFHNDRLTLKVLGKNVTIDQQGRFYSDIHHNMWVVAPAMIYVARSKGRPLTGEWLGFRDLDGGPERYPLFKKRGEEGLKAVADNHTGLFDDIVHLFSGKQVDSLFDSDISVVLPVFPLVPVALCYWQADDGIASELHLFFDRSVDANLGAGAAFTLGTGLAQMFEKLVQTHKIG